MKRLGLLALLLIAAIGAGAGWLDSQISRPYRGHRPEKVFVDIPHGSSRWQIAGILREEDVIRNRLAFTLFSYWHFRRPIQAGEYYFDQPVNTREVFWKMARGRIYVRTILVPEGWTSFDIAEEIQEQGICDRDQFLVATHETSLISNIAPQAHSLEGFLFPSTYEFTRHNSCEEVAKRMVENFKAVWDSIKPADLQTLPGGLTPLQIVTLASLVERETPDPEERPLVAGVFYNRLRKGVPLQCDPTVQYALALEGQLVKDVKPKDLKVDSPYNTYTHTGLPPGPIANPGEASLRAALAPEVTDYLYFVANDKGGHFFAKTLAEHDRNVKRLRSRLNADAQAVEGASKKPQH
ncbi:MAG: endolytic transglycosylase MltG [Candidatus Acidiferrales bacterium]